MPFDPHTDMQPLPIDASFGRIESALARDGSVVVVAPPGAGKTTRVPPGLLRAGIAGEREVVVLEPRRLAARVAARRVASEMGERTGETVGYQVRFEDVSSARTRVRFLTEGVFLRRLLGDPGLERVGAVVLDEAHERHVQGDLALGLVRGLQRSARPDLRVVAMSATMDAEPVARFLGGCEIVASEGRPFEVAIDHLEQADDRPLDKQVASAVRRIAIEGPAGDLLVFLPGAAEIRRAARTLARAAATHDLEVLALHGDMSAEEQDRALAPSRRRKLILATNVAETSITIEGVAAVIDSGLARVAGHATWSGLPTLRVAKISRASAAQRAGRAGRLGPGRCLRLYTKADFDTRAAFETPEVRRADLCETLLMLHGAGVGAGGGSNGSSRHRPRRSRPRRPCCARSGPRTHRVA